MIRFVSRVHALWRMVEMVERHLWALICFSAGAANPGLSLAIRLTSLDKSQK